MSTETQPHSDTGVAAGELPDPDRGVDATGDEAASPHHAHEMLQSLSLPPSPPTASSRDRAWTR